MNYFKNYHTERLDELKIFLENETWEVCPVKPTFDILQLQEFKSIKSILKNYKTLSHINSYITSESNSSNNSQDGSSVIGNYFTRYAEHGTPFDTKLDETIIEEDILVNMCDEASGYFSEESDESDELKKDFVDEYVDENNER